MSKLLSWLPVWQRNVRVWRKLLIPSLIGNFVDPLIYLLALGFGLGHFVGKLDGIPYLMFLASGIICASSMQAASFEALYSVYTRLSWQQTWDGMLATPLDVKDIVLGEALWAGTKGLINATAIFIVAALLGLVTQTWALWILPVVFLVGCCFAAMALIVTSFAKSYDFFTYYMTLFISPMMFLSGVFFPIDRMPYLVQQAAKLFPLYHAVQIVRPLMVNQPVHNLWLHLSVLIAYAIAAYFVAVILLKRRVIS